MASLPLLQADLNTSPKMNQRADQLKSELAEATDVILLERHNACSQRNPVAIPWSENLKPTFRKIVTDAYRPYTLHANVSCPDESLRKAKTA